MSFSTALPSCSSLWQSEFYLKYCGAAPWAGCWWRQEWSVGAISFQMFHLALDNKIQELTAWKCLGAQCFFTGCNHRDSHSGQEQTSHWPAESLKASAGRWKFCPSVYHAWGSLLVLRTQPQCVQLSSSSCAIPLPGSIVHATCEKREICTWAVPAWTC